MVKDVYFKRGFMEECCLCLIPNHKKRHCKMKASSKYRSKRGFRRKVRFESCSAKCGSFPILPFFFFFFFLFSSSSSFLLLLMLTCFIGMGGGFPWYVFYSGKQEHKQPSFQGPLIMKFCGVCTTRKMEKREELGEER